jgi:hypothetical protein
MLQEQKIANQWRDELTKKADFHVVVIKPSSVFPPYRGEGV